MFLHRGPQAVHGSIKMGWRQIAAHHFIAQKHAVGGEHIGQAVIRHFGQPAGCHISLNLATVYAPIFTGTFARAAISARLGLAEAP